MAYITYVIYLIVVLHYHQQINMIKFFRKIRQKLLMENKTGKYLKYAIGEIILVVIGILIALSINNWNTARIQQQESFELSTRLYKENEGNIAALKTVIARHDSVIHANLKLLQLMGEDYTSVDAQVLDSLMADGITDDAFYDNSSVLTEAISSGKLAFLKSNTLKDKLYAIPPLLSRVQSEEKSIKEEMVNYLSPIIRKSYSLRQMDFKFSSFKNMLGASVFKNNDGRQILNNFEFENALDELYYLRNALKKRYNELLAKYKNTSDLLAKEIEK
jgi:hypothetical protein